MGHLWKLIMFYQRETLSKYPKAKIIQDISLTTLQENQKLIAGVYQKKYNNKEIKQQQQKTSPKENLTRVRGERQRYSSGNAG